MVTNQKQGDHHRVNRDQAAPLERSRRRGHASDSTGRKSRGQQLLLEGEVVHGQVIREVWEGDRRRRMEDERMKNMREEEGEKRRIQLEQTFGQKLKNTCLVFA